MQAIYARYFDICKREIATLDEGVSLLCSGSEAGELFEIGVYDEATKTLYINEDETDIMGLPDSRVFVRKVREVKKLGYEVQQVQRYGVRVTFKGEIPPECLS